jgi:hypothetical protein
MSDFFGDLALRSTGEAVGVVARVPARFEPSAQGVDAALPVERADVSEPGEAPTRPSTPVRRSVPEHAPETAGTRERAAPPASAAEAALETAPVTQEPRQLASPPGTLSRVPITARPATFSELPREPAAVAERQAPLRTAEPLPVHGQLPERFAPVTGPESPPVRVHEGVLGTRVSVRPAAPVRESSWEEHRAASLPDEAAPPPEQLAPRDGTRARLEPARQARAQALPARARPVESPAPSSEPTIVVTIGRVEVRAQVTQAPNKARPASALTSLERFLQDRAEQR